MIPVRCLEVTDSLSYLNQGEDFILHNCRWVVFRRDDFNKHPVDKVPAGDQSMKPMAAVLHTRLKDLQGAENTGLESGAVSN